jgi:hypothetical protein
MKLKRAPTLSALILASVGLVQPVQANDSGICRKARSVLGEEFKDATEERCQQALDTADEERWELWLAVASAAELSGDLDRAALSLDRFVRDADKRGRLPSHWAAIRDEARTTIARLDGEVLKTKARVTITSMPEGAEVELVGTPKRPNAERTPTTRYFTPGNHTLRLVLDPDINREVAFTVKAGQALELKVDLRPDAPKDLAVTETKAPAVLGSQASVEVVKTTPTDNKTVTTTPADASTGQTGPGSTNDPAAGTKDGGTGTAGGTSSTDGTSGSTGKVEPRPVPDPDDLALVKRETGTWTKVGTVAVALGGASLAAGVVFILQATGLDDEAACSGLACEVDQPLRARVKDEASVAWTRAAGALIAGAILVGGGITAIVKDEPDEPAGSTTISPWFSPEGAGVSGLVRF